MGFFALGQALFGIITAVAVSVFWGIYGILRRAVPYVPQYLITVAAALGTVLVLAPALLIIKMYAGLWVLGYSAAVLASLGIGILWILWVPFGVWFGKRYAQALGTALFVELLVVLGALFVPFETSPAWILPFLLVAVTWGIGKLRYGSGFNGRRWLGAVGILLVFLLTAFLLPRFFNSLGGRWQQFDRCLAGEVECFTQTASASASSRPGAERFMITFKTGQRIDPITLTPCMDYNVFPELGGRAQGVFADDPARRAYHFPYQGDLPFQGPLYLEGEGSAEVVFHGLNDVCLASKRYGRKRS